ncbi:MAG TPA: hypothetical protein VD993_17605 [Chitinophagaceae bacterium]|nr:hypothetical protein [Chitinophagaceae bacterium]
MRTRKWLLFFCSIGLLIMFFMFPRNREWAGTVIGYWNSFPKQQKHLDLETRMRLRFGNNYIYSKNIADSLRNRTSHPNALILMPPSSYFSKMGLKYHVPEPAVFYYYTGIKTIWANSKHAMDARWYVRVSNGRIILDSITDKRMIQDTIREFVKLGVSL